VLAQGAAWRAAGSHQAGRSLVEAACSDDEDVATLAGILLTRGGDRAVPLIDEAIARGERSPVLTDILMSVGSDAAKSVLRSVAESEDSALQEAAAESLTTLEQFERHKGTNPT